MVTSSECNGPFLEALCLPNVRVASTPLEPCAAIEGVLSVLGVMQGDTSNSRRVHARLNQTLLANEPAPKTSDRCTIVKDDQ